MSWWEIFEQLIENDQKFSVQHYGGGMFNCSVAGDKEADLTEDEAKVWMIDRLDK